MIDLHSHTTASDGALSPEALVQRAAARGVKTLSITDHDTFGALEEASHVAARVGIELIPGVEISATRSGGNSLHVVGLFVDTRSEVLLDALVRLRGGREQRNRRLAARLTELGMPLTYEEVAALADGTVGRPHFAQAMIARGYVADAEEAFALWLGDGKPAAIDKEVLAPAEAAEAVHRAGGVAVLAHPLAYGRSAGQVEPQFRLAAAAKLDAAEVYCANATAGEVDMLACFADRYGLLRSGGSDFHREPWPTGSTLPAAHLAALSARAAQHRGNR